MILSRIRYGVYRPGDRIPSESDLASELSVSRASVRTALARIESHGHVMRKHGEGTFVSRRAPAAQRYIADSWDMQSIIEAAGLKPRVEALAAVERTATDDEARSLGMQLPGRVFEFTRLFSGGDQPVALTNDVVPPYRYAGPVSKIDGSMFISDIVRQCCGLEIAYVESRMSASNAPETVAQRLQVEPGAALLQLNDVFFSVGDETPVVLSRALLNSRRVPIHLFRQWTRSRGHHRQQQLFHEGGQK